MKNQIIIVGNGLAGLTAAITAAEAGQKVYVIAQSSPDRTQSVMAAGGINASLNTKGEDDSPEQHCKDTFRAGGAIADENAVEQLTKHAPEIIAWLERIGVLFTRDQKGKVDLRNFGGQKKKRTVYSKAGIGKQLICGLSQEFRRYKAAGMIEVHEYCYFLEPILVDGRACGCVFYDEREDTYQKVFGKALIIASGGMSGLFEQTTGSLQSDGSVTAALFCRGVKLSNLEMIQYHPTTVSAASKRMLISEAARGEGGRLLVIKDNKPWHFMEDWYPQGGNLMPRDIVSKSIYRVCRELKLGVNGEDLVYLDMTQLPKEKLNNELKEVTNLCKKYLNLDSSKDMIPVYPGVHYFMGGIDVDTNHRTNLSGLYAAGECCSQYHGANRLGGNSTLGAIYGGKTAAQNAAKEKTPDAEILKKAQEAADRLMNQLKDKKSSENQCGSDWISQSVKKEIHAIMSNSMGIVRSEDALKAGIDKCTGLQEKDVECDKNQELISLALAVLKSAEIRKETRGAQIRTDFPERNEAYTGLTQCIYSAGEIKTTLLTKGDEER